MREKVMGKKVIRIGSDKESGRVIIGKDVSVRDGKGHGTSKSNQQSSQDKPVRRRP